MICVCVWMIRDLDKNQGNCKQTEKREVAFENKTKASCARELGQKKKLETGHFVKLTLR